MGRNIYIKNSRFVLREWQKEDEEELAELANNKKIYDNLRDAFPHPYTKEDAKAYIAMMSANKKDVGLAIEIDGKLAGSIGAFFKEDVYRKSAEIGYYLGEAYWGKGIMTEAVKVLTAYVFANYDINRIYAEPFARNIGSRRTLEKAGFILEGVLKQSVIKNNIFEDSCIYALLNLQYSTTDIKNQRECSKLTC